MTKSIYAGTKAKNDSIFYTSDIAIVKILNNSYFQRSKDF